MAVPASYASGLYGVENESPRAGNSPQLSAAARPVSFRLVGVPCSCPAPRTPLCERWSGRLVFECRHLPVSCTNQGGTVGWCR